MSNKRVNAIIMTVSALFLGSVLALNVQADIEDITRWTYDPATSLLTSKTYPDNSTIHFSYWHDQLKRVTYASGKWKEHQYNVIDSLN